MKRRGACPQDRGSISVLIADNRRSGVNPDAWTAGAWWKREADIPNRVLFGALEALEEGGA
jgi:hypothetical protein